MNREINRVLVIGPHTDDAEFGCGGFISKLVANNTEVTCVAFSICEESVPEGFPNDILKTEMLQSMDKLGIHEENCVIMKYPVRRFHEYRQEILEEMVKINRDYNPDLVICPSIHDIHQDHHVIAEESMRAFKKKCLISYETTWNNYEFDNQMFVQLSDIELNKKIEAIKCYKTQHKRDYSDPSFITSLARVHGVQIGCSFAEVFEVVRWVLA